MTSAFPSARDVTTEQTLDLLEGTFKEFATGFADGRYVLWLGSGISRDRVPGLPEVIAQVIGHLHARLNAGDPSCRFRRALHKIVELAGLDKTQRDAFDLDDEPSSWPPLNIIIDRLVGRYSEVLATRVDLERRDYLLWDAVDVRDTFGKPNDPDCEHLLIALLAFEGVVPNAVSANWDGLIEAAVVELAGDVGQILRVVVRPIDLREPDREMTLIKFHGCAVRAAEDPDTYRKLLISTRAQLDRFSASAQWRPIQVKLVDLASSKPTLMLGLSAQDADIQLVFATAQDQMAWRWPTDPPALVFSDDELGGDHRNILETAYADQYDDDSSKIENGAVLRAFGKPLLTALTLTVLRIKVVRYLATIEAPHLSGAAREELSGEFAPLVRLIAGTVGTGYVDFARLMYRTVGRTLRILDGTENAASPSRRYRPLSTRPADRVDSEPSLASTGIREAAAVLAVLSRGRRHGMWELSTSRVGSGASGMLTVSRAGRSTAVFVVANETASVRLMSDGHVRPDASDVVIVHTSKMAPSMTRSPRPRLGRTGATHPVNVDISEMLRAAGDVDALVSDFQKAAGL